MSQNLLKIAETTVRELKGKLTEKASFPLMIGENI